MTRILGNNDTANIGTSQTFDPDEAISGNTDYLNEEIQAVGTFRVVEVNMYGEVRSADSTARPSMGIALWDGIQTGGTPDNNPTTVVWDWDQANGTGEAINGGSEGTPTTMTITQDDGLGAANTGLGLGPDNTFTVNEPGMILIPFVKPIDDSLRIWRGSTPTADSRFVVGGKLSSDTMSDITDGDLAGATVGAANNIFWLVLEEVQIGGSNTVAQHITAQMQAFLEARGWTF